MNKQTKILIKGNKAVTLEELFEQKEKTRKLMAALPFAEKIKMLVSLQELARNWGKKEDVITWKLN